MTAIDELADLVASEVTSRVAQRLGLAGAPAPAVLELTAAAESTGVEDELAETVQRLQVDLDRSRAETDDAIAAIERMKEQLAASEARREVAEKRADELTARAAQLEQDLEWERKQKTDGKPTPEDLQRVARQIAGVEEAEPPPLIAPHLIRAAREKAGLSVEQLADASRISMTLLVDVEHGRITPSPEQHKRICRALAETKPSSVEKPPANPNGSAGNLENEAIDPALPIRERTARLLGDGQPRTIVEIARLIKAKEGSVAATISKHADQFHRSYEKGVAIVRLKAVV